eukprot:CAMPEP_0170642668 /NCGR_PEP_ID=MMETSP0224-20130122/41453_1 /TAXON_ID=285029 /ORGANISM="Togula jolla, Strain CCCM 725" /LENGTH=62 /DNA_ID=CAMNT_0010973401 /DNA_START=315 /DNA_END=503 /DNA_ORIENTATION=-
MGRKMRSRITMKSPIPVTVTGNSPPGCSTSESNLEVQEKSVVCELKEFPVLWTGATKPADSE